MDDSFNNTPQQSKDYDSFTFLSNNRPPVRGHIEAIKKAFDETGNFTQVQPILVNENKQIIDGQHRFIACKETGRPFWYVIVPGLGISEAREMNILHRGWTTDDFAHSYAEGGNHNYITYLRLKDQFQLTHTGMLLVLNGGPEKGLFRDFRAGEFKMPDPVTATNKLKAYEEVIDAIGMVARNQTFIEGYLQVSKIAGFDKDRFIRKARQYGHELKAYRNTGDTLRQLEDIYNYNQPENSRLRLF